MEAPMKLKKCSVKLNRLSFIDPEEIQERILDLRIRKCSVKLQRLIMPTTNLNGHKMKRFCIKLRRLQVARSDISSPSASVVSAEMLSEVDFNDFENDQM